ncbi:hypothetical protein C8J56DRAFT_954956 [Mycena floridula]|nr:hypothetical protein C8J56DRAFT_954956 [Mycena floridula]
MTRGTRRSPPTALRLITGPTPPRSTPKHTLPSVPRPTFHSPSTIPRGPSSPPRRQLTTLPQPGLDSPSDYPTSLFTPTGYDSTTSSTPSSTASFSPRSSPKALRGPWDHSGSILVPIDLEHCLTPLKPVLVRETN